MPLFLFQVRPDVPPLADVIDPAVGKLFVDVDKTDASAEAAVAKHRYCTQVRSLCPL